MDFATFQMELNAVKHFDNDEDYEKFDRLIETVEGTEGIQWLHCLLDAVCVEDDFGPYEGLHNAIWRFPPEMVGGHLGEYLPSFQRRMSFAPFQVWCFYIPICQIAESQNAFIAAALQWNEADRKLALETMLNWSDNSAREEAEWAPVLQALGYVHPAPQAASPIPSHWPKPLQEKMQLWRQQPPDITQKKVFWEGGKAANGDQWQRDLPYLVEALSLHHGAKWRDIKVWLNPFGTFANYLLGDFEQAFSQASPAVQNQALIHIKKVRPQLYQKLKDMGE